MANNANSTLTTDFNIAPYYDDHNPSKNYYRIVFRPGRAIQARELTQMQTSMQKQIDRIGKHLFREGSIVIPGQFNIETDLDYIKIKDTDASNNSIDVSDFLNQTLTGNTNGISAVVVEVADGTESDTDTKMLFIRYQSSASANSQITKFTNSEVLSCNIGTAIALDTAAAGQGSRFVISEGAFFAKEHVIAFDSQSIILSRTDTSPSCRVGFYITEEIVDYTDDLSLLDPALEASNYSAPGADRLKLTAALQVFDLSNQTSAPNFVELFTIQDGIITELYERTQYNVIRDELAKRTYDESGDYYVNGLSIRVRENLDTGTNDGYSNTGNSQLLSVGVEPGVAYVKGYEVGKLVTTYVTTDKSNSYDNVNSQIITTSYGNYIKANEFSGSVKHDEGTVVYLRDTANRKLTNKLWASGAAVGSIIGTASLHSIEYDSGMLGTLSGNVNIFLTDVKMNGTNSFSNTRSVTASNFGADIILDTSNNAILKETAIGTLLYPVGVTGVRTLRDSSGNPDMSFVFKRTSDVSIASDGTLDLTLSTSETFPYGTVSSLSDQDSRDVLLSFAESCNITASGTVTANAGNGGTTTLIGSGTSFTRFNTGDKIEIAGTSNTYFIATIANNTLLTTTETLRVGISGNTFFKAYKTGDVIDMTGIGVTAGTDRTIGATSSQLSFDIKETLGSPKTAKVTYQVARTGAKEASKALRSDRYVIINCNTAGVSGPFGLGIADVYNIVSITKKTGSAPTSTTDGTNVTSNFIFDNGQRDALYEHASITPTIALSATDYLLVKLDYFEPSYNLGVGYFSVDSYPVDDNTISDTTIRTEEIPVYISPSTGYYYDLRNMIDFRPVKTRTAADATTVGGATTNPSRSSAFNYESNGLRLPVPSSQATLDYSYYLARRDVVVMDKDGNVSIIQGTPGAVPRTPQTPENFMILGSIYVAPYPSLAPNYAQTIMRRDLGCSVKKLSNVRHTMRDIGVLKNRISNLEYYATLSALEKSALDMQIVDEDGLNRFKNGIFVDSFIDHSLGDTLSTDYRIIVDPKERSIRPVYTMNSLYYDYLSGTGVTKTGDLITLPYTDVTLLSQNVATSTRNVELSSYRFVGTLELTPETDVWVDTDQLPDEEIFIGPSANNLPQTQTTWGAWNTITGETPERVTQDGQMSYADKFHTSTTQFNSLRDRTYYAQYGAAGVASTSTRTGLQTTYTTIENSVELGNLVTNVSLAAYIKPQLIKVYAQGLKANTRYHVFFDGENLSDYVSALTETQYRTTSPTINWIGEEGDDVVSNDNGEVFCALRLPYEKRFRVGTKEVVFTDNPTNSMPDASSFAKGYFVSHGLIQQKQDTILTTRQVIQKEKTVTQTNRTYYYYDFPSCAAYSFLVKAPEGEEGLFLSKVELFFAAKHPKHGVWFEVREMDSAGGITRNQVPFSEVWIKAEDLIISDDSTLPQTVTFKAPIFLYNDKQYAFIIHTVGINPDTYFWISRIGETNIATGEKHNTRALAGTFYTTNNNLNWDIVPDIDLKINFYRASFTTGVTGTFELGNESYEKLLVSNVTSGFVNLGEPVIGDYRLTLSGNTGSIAVTDVLIGANSGANSAVSNVSGIIFKVANTSYIDGERVNVYYGSNLTSKAVSSLITSIESASGDIYNYKNVTTAWGEFEGAANTSTAQLLEVKGSNGNFRVGDTLSTSQTGRTATIDSIRNMRYSVVDFEPSYLSFVKTSVAFEMQPTSNAGVQGSYTRVNNNDSFAFNTEQVILSKSNEEAVLGGLDRSNQVRISMSTSTSYLSPVIDLGRTHSVYIDNIINANTDGETAATGGKLINKYISKPVVLEEDQDAEDIEVRVTAYRPPSSDMKVWIKILHNEDSDTLAEASWIELEKSTTSGSANNVYSSLSNINDFKGYRFVFPESSLTGPNGEVQYVNSQGITFTGYKYFCFKIGLTGTNSAVVPRVADLRSIALQK